MRWLTRIGWLLLLVGLLPVISILVASAISALAGCNVNEGIITPCVIGGTDYGETLAYLFTFGWMIFFTLPLVIIGAALLLIRLVQSLLARRRSGG